VREWLRWVRGLREWGRSGRSRAGFSGGRGWMISSGLHCGPNKWTNGTTTCELECPSQSRTKIPVLTLYFDREWSWLLLACTLIDWLIASTHLWWFVCYCPIEPKWDLSIVLFTIVVAPIYTIVSLLQDYPTPPKRISLSTTYHRLSLLLIEAKHPGSILLLDRLFHYAN